LDVVEVLFEALNREDPEENALKKGFNLLRKCWRNARIA
jgi:hypothetical protein